MTPIPPAAEDLDHRRPVWEALSTLFLDTDTLLLRDWRARQLVASPYSIAQLEHILIDEVYPVLRWNLLSVAGVWDGFDLPWLEQQILRRLRSPWRRWHRLHLGRLTVPKESEWRATKREVQAARAA